MVARTYRKDTGRDYFYELSQAIISIGATAGECPMSFLRIGSRIKAVKIDEERDSLWVAAQTSHISAHELTATVAPFQAWRNLQLIIARGPERATIAKRGDYSCFECYLQALFRHTFLLFRPTLYH
jgi:hypothetical protein